MEAADLELLTDDGLTLVRWATGRQAVARRAAGDADEAARLRTWGMLAEAELTRRGVPPEAAAMTLAA